MNESKPTAKPFAISKRVVWEAYEKVKANQGAAGVDGESIAGFEENLKGNLYRLWNRMSSGSYFPPPVRAVEIPKKAGGQRTLGVPTVADRIAQTVVRCTWSPRWNRCSTPTPTAIGRGALPTTHWRHAGSVAGSSTGSSILTFGRSSTAFRSRPHAEGGVQAHGPAVGPPLRRSGG